MNVYSLNNHRNKCRCCFEMLEGSQKKVIISENIRNKFFSFTQIHLKVSSRYSNVICQKCAKDLDGFARFKRDASAKQRHLYDTFPVQDSDKKENLVWDELSQEYSITDSLKDSAKMEKPETKVVWKECSDDQKNPNEEQILQVYIKQEAEIDEKEDKFFNDNAELLKKELFDLVTHEPLKRICDKCGYKTLGPKRILAHVLTHTPKECREAFICGAISCKFKSINKNNLASHKNHRNLEENCQCEICGLPFAFRNCLNWHMRVHALEGHIGFNYKFKCSSCFRKFLTQTKLDAHILNQHTESTTKSFLCNFCGKTFVSKSQLSEHSKNVHEEKKFVCPFDGCGKRFRKKGHWKNHQVTHTKERNFHCSKCPATYGLREALMIHDKVEHQGLRCYCELPGCGQVIRRKENFQKHLKNHHKLSPHDVRAILMRTKYK